MEIVYENEKCVVYKDGNEYFILITDGKIRRKLRESCIYTLNPNYWIRTSGGRYIKSYSMDKVYKMLEIPSEVVDKIWDDLGYGDTRRIHKSSTV